MKVKIISLSSQFTNSNFEEAINNFLATIPDQCIVDIKINNNIALVLYKDPDKMKYISTAH